MHLTADGRGRTQTFCPADLAGQKPHALRAGEVGRTRRSTQEGTICFYRAAIAGFSPAGRGDERFMQQNARAFSCRLRQSA